MLETSKKKIALVGSAPSSIRLAPYDDPEWFIAGCSPGAYGVARRSDAWFEIHRWEPQIPGKLGSGQPWFSVEYVEFMIRHPGIIWMATPAPEVPHARAIPMRELAEKYGPYFWTSSLSYMFAMALETPGVTDIGLWGVDMSAHEEYSYQRPGCQYFITLAMQRGINIHIPPESDLLQPNYWYGIGENTPMMIKLTARRVELTNRMVAAQQRIQQASLEEYFCTGALDDIDYVIKTWNTYQSFVQPKMGETGNEQRS